MKKPGLSLLIALPISAVVTVILFFRIIRDPALLLRIRAARLTQALGRCNHNTSTS